MRLSRVKKSIDIPEGATNEDALNIALRNIFPRTIFIRMIDAANKTQGIIASDEWLAMPYRGTINE